MRDRVAKPGHHLAVVRVLTKIIDITGDHWTESYGHAIDVSCVVFSPPSSVVLFFFPNTGF